MKRKVIALLLIVFAVPVPFVFPRKAEGKIRIPSLHSSTEGSYAHQYAMENKSHTPSSHDVPPLG